MARRFRNECKQVKKLVDRIRSAITSDQFEAVVDDLDDAIDRLYKAAEETGGDWDVAEGFEREAEAAKQAVLDRIFAGARAARSNPDEPQEAERAPRRFRIQRIERPRVVKTEDGERLTTGDLDYVPFIPFDESPNDPSWANTPFPDFVFHRAKHPNDMHWCRAHRQRISEKIGDQVVCQFEDGSILTLTVDEAYRWLYKPARSIERREIPLEERYQFLLRGKQKVMLKSVPSGKWYDGKAGVVLYAQSKTSHGSLIEHPITVTGYVEEREGTQKSLKILYVLLETGDPAWVWGGEADPLDPELPVYAKLDTVYSRYLDERRAEMRARVYDEDAEAGREIKAIQELVRKHGGL